MALPPPHRGLVIPAGQLEDPNISDAVMGSRPRLPGGGGSGSRSGSPCLALRLAGRVGSGPQRVVEVLGYLVPFGLWFQG